MESTFLRTSSGEALLRDACVVSLSVAFTVVLSFSTLKWTTLKFLRRSSKGRRRSGWSWRLDLVICRLMKVP